MKSDRLAELESTHANKRMTVGMG
ncbi:hypothetical protein PHAMO_270284 [Magnetospirillum molischianum DSM 120]|uniref:Uncharacterized protein n=1 Tax=Magnetospirillum molischianum DSM 120 TaxID=1150626 RepID=H8FSV5_MAGML|nr:hypothetical protein PHAMO_270284 [Magnetospirillum molischianum DSM 120]